MTGCSGITDRMSSERLTGYVGMRILAVFYDLITNCVSSADAAGGEQLGTGAPDKAAKAGRAPMG